MRLLALKAYVSTWIIEVIDAGLRIVHVETAGVDDNLAGGVHFHVRAVHRPRRGPFEINGLGIVTTTVTRALEFVLCRLPFGCATKVSANSVNNEEPVRFLDDPDTMAHQELLIDAQIEIRRKTNRKDSIRLVERPRKEKPQEHQEVDAEIPADGRPDDAPAHAIRRNCGGFIGAGFGCGRFCRNRCGSGGLGD